MIGFRPVPVTKFNMLIDGYGLGGKIDDITLPKLSIKTEDQLAGALDMPTEIDVGMNKMECEFTVLDYDPYILTKLGFSIGGGPSVNVRGAMKREGAPAIPLSITLQGMIKECDFGNWKAGDAKKTLKVKMSVNYYLLSIGGVDMIEINALSGLRKIGGIMQNADVNAAIGLVATF